jgi:hypothetical protein
MREPMKSNDIALVFQGKWTEQTDANIRAARNVMPEARIILSTFVDEEQKVFSGALDAVVLTPDPGALPAYKFASGSPVNNVNRQIATSRAGLFAADTNYAVKIRTDCTLESSRFADLYKQLRMLDPSRERIIASSLYTTHPKGIEAFQFHVSDWFHFGATEQLRAYWDVPLMTIEDAVWFERRKHSGNSSYFARLYRARFAPEQYLSVMYARKRGYRTPSCIDHASSEITEDYEKFLANEFLICSPSTLGLVFPKYSRLLRSNYQFFNCVWAGDWVEFWRKHSSLQAPFTESTKALGERIIAPSAECRDRAVTAMKKIDSALPLIKRIGLMPVVGKTLALYR